MAPFATLAPFVEGRAMIVRVWQGVAPQCKLSEHVAYIREHLLHTYLKALGNRGAILLSRAQADHTEFLLVSFWESAFHLEALTGPEIDGALAKELISHSPIVKNYEVVAYHLPLDGTPNPAERVEGS